MNPAPPNHFDRSKPFYPIVMAYLVQLAGFKQLAFSATVTKAIPLAGAGTPQPAGPLTPVDPRLGAVIQEGNEMLAKPLELRSEYQRAPVVVDIKDFAWELASNGPYLAHSLIRSAGHVLVLAHELSKDRNWHNTDPLWEFLRHCRNAVAHGSSFHFLRGEPRRPACWGPFNLTLALQDTRLFKGEDGIGLLWPGDPVRMLWDIEQAYPAMTA